jgi:hypothetical protein
VVYARVKPTCSSGFIWIIRKYRIIGIIGPTTTTIQGKFHPRTGHKGPEGVATHFLTSNIPCPSRYPGTTTTISPFRRGSECFVVMVRYHGSSHGFSTSGVDWRSLILCKLKYVRTHVYTFFTVENIVFNNSQPLIRNKAEVICVWMFIYFQFILQESQGQQNIWTCILL